MNTALHLTSFDALLPALDRVRGSEPGAGAVLAHCAHSIECSLTGYPSLRPAWFRATIGRLVKRRFLARGEMKHDTSAGLPGLPPIGGDTPVTAAVERLRAAIAAFRNHGGPLAPHPVYGDCDKSEYEQLHAMHVADHLTALSTA